MKTIIKCTFCNKEKSRYINKDKPSQQYYCSLQCKGDHQKTSNKGCKNPNYRGRDKKRICDCGKEKDHRSQKCSLCGKKGFPIEEQFKEKRLFLIKNTVSKCTSFSEISKHLGISRKTVSDVIKENNIDISHFPTQRTLEDFFIVGQKRINGTIRKKILENNLLSYKCKLCGLGDVWNNDKITLELDHINGNPYYNRIFNLRFLCPNCHSQTSTNKGKNSKMKNKTKESSERKEGGQ